MHLHSVHSDGKRTVDEIVAAARQEGLHFIATSDHNTSSTGVTWRGIVPRHQAVGARRSGRTAPGPVPPRPTASVRRGAARALPRRAPPRWGVGWHASCRGRRRPAGASRG
ncbi:hypothetical protein ACFYZ4_01275 [Streptomyces sp. NPDC001513]|uniref:hypothetical protein n=1 Tax=Streptomyces sp. NPDC001513 TaxID=3364580 RepID=UPI0036884D76